MHACIQFWGWAPITIKPNRMASLPSFSGEIFSWDYWNSLPENTLYHIMDLWQAKYSDAEVKVALGISSVPTLDFIHSRLLLCSRCSSIGHLVMDCKARICDKCTHFQCACICRNNPIPRECTICNDRGHEQSFCPALWKCYKCSFLGHLGRNCERRSPGDLSLTWKPKRSPALTVK